MSYTAVDTTGVSPSPERVTQSALGGARTVPPKACCEQQKMWVISLAETALSYFR